MKLLKDKTIFPPATPAGVLFCLLYILRMYWRKQAENHNLPLFFTIHGNTFHCIVKPDALYCVGLINRLFITKIIELYRLFVIKIIELYRLFVTKIVVLYRLFITINCEINRLFVTRNTKIYRLFVTKIKELYRLYITIIAKLYRLFITIFL